MITIAGKRMDGGVDIKFVENKGNVRFKKNSMNRKL
jgi:ABC-2 type transport system permease protein